jgi:hypothetical protein
MKDLKAIRFISGTKISHDYSGKDIKTFSYSELVSRGTEAIGIPAKPNGLIIIDIDVAGESHRNDGREWWSKFMRENKIPAAHTYTVQTPSGGFHFYYRLPDYINKETFSPPAQLAPGVDIKYNGWVGAPPTAGYSITHGTTQSIIVAPEPLMKAISDKIKNKTTQTFDTETGEVVALELHRPFTPEQIKILEHKIPWVQKNCTLSYHEWRDGIFALKAGITDPAKLEEFVLAWTRNRSWNQGDDEIALKLAERANPQGGIGPGSLFSIISQLEIRHGAPIARSTFTTKEILDRIGLDNMDINKDGGFKLKPSEHNAALIMSAAFSEEELYHDIRSNHYIFRGKPCSEAEIVNEIIPLFQSKTEGLGMTDFKKAIIAAGLDVLMARRRVDPHRKFLEKLTWDGVPRIEQFFTKYCNVPDSEYIRLVGKNFWTSLAARGLNPGCKIDSMVVIEGNEGVRKSSLCQAIGGKYTYAPFDQNAFQNLDDLRQMHQAVVVELPELIGIIGQKEESVKNFLSKPYDDIRSLYEKRAMRNLRGFVFIGTTNSSRYLTQGMGKRRFWPVKIPNNSNRIDLIGIEVDREQLFAEGVYWFRQGHPFYHMPNELLDPVIGEKIIVDPISEAVISAVQMYSGKFSTADVYRALEPLGLVNKGLTFPIAKRIEDVLSNAGLQSSFDEKKKCTYWSKPKEPDVFDFI